MDRFIALFYALDNKDMVCRTEVRETSINPEDEPGEFKEWAVGALTDVAREHSNVGFAGVYDGPDEPVLTVTQIMELVASYEEGLTSSFFQRHDHNTDFFGEVRGHRSLDFAIETASANDCALWYETESEIPYQARDFFAPYTLIYVDYESETVVSAPIYLYEDFEAALVKFLIDEEFGVIGPIALFGGHVEPLLTGDILEPEEETFRAEGSTALVNVEKGPIPAVGGPRQPVPQVLARHLVQQAVVDFAAHRDDDLARRIVEEGGEPFDAFLTILSEKRPLVLVETQYWEIAENVGRYISESLGLDFVSANSYYEPYEQRRFRSSDRVIYYDDQLFAGDYELDRTSVRALVKDLVTSRDVGLVVVSNARAIPLTFQNYMDMELQLPALVGPVRDAVFLEVLGPDALNVPDLDAWTRYLLPFDFEKVLAAGYMGERAVHELKDRVDRRLARRAAVGGPALSEINGMGEAREVAEQLVADIRHAVAGSIDWSEVDRGMLLVGPPGTGKTMLARAISRESGIRFIAGSALEWQASGALDSHLASIRDFFAEARRYAPTIVFIDEFDSIGNRQHHQGRNDYYTTAVVNCVLEELQGFVDREGVIVIAATNEESKIDPALKRAGRLDQTVVVRRPNVESLSKIYDYHLGLLRAKGQVGDDIDTEELAKLTFGQTGADVEFYVRGARRRARKEGRLVGQADLLAEIMRSPTGTTGLHRMTEEEVRRTAVHEAGHALVQLLGPKHGADISYVSIIPRADGTLGFVASYDDRVDIRKADVLEQVRVFLAGRAAEEVVYGRQNVGAGSGGSTGSDLAQATRLLVRMFLQHGYSETNGLLWFDVDRREKGNMELPDAVKFEVQEALEREYRATVKRVQNNRKKLDLIVDLLLAHQEITGTELRAAFFARRGLLSWFGGTPRAARAAPRIEDRSRR